MLDCLTRARESCLGLRSEFWHMSASTLLNEPPSSRASSQNPCSRLDGSCAFSRRGSCSLPTRPAFRHVMSYERGSQMERTSRIRQAAVFVGLSISGISRRLRLGTRH